MIPFTMSSSYVPCIPFFHPLTPSLPVSQRQASSDEGVRWCSGCGCGVGGKAGVGGRDDCAPARAVPGDVAGGVRGDPVPGRGRPGTRRCTIYIHRCMHIYRTINANIFGSNTVWL